MKALFFVSSTIIFLCQLSMAYTVEKVGKTEVIFKLDGQAVAKDQQYYIVDKAGKKKALVQVSVFNSSQAKAKLIKGSVAEVTSGMMLTALRSPASTPDGSGDSAAQIVTKPLKAKNSWGVLGSYMMNSMSTKFSFASTNQTANMTGTGFGALGYYDFGLNKDLQIRTSGGIEQFAAKQQKDAAVCNSTTECNVSISG
jgi:hypothetical protein